MDNSNMQNHDFIGHNLKLARVLNGLTLAELAEKIQTSRQYIHQLETGVRYPSSMQLVEIANRLHVKESFFHIIPTGVLDDTSIHFRSNRTAKQSSRVKAKANVALFIRSIDVLSQYVCFPDIDFPSEENFNANPDIEKIAEQAREYWKLGSGPIDNITRLAECSGAIVTSFSGVSEDVDALSSVIKRPVIVRNDAKDSPGRLRFDIAHEIGHIIMHQDMITGCKQTEAQANRFASAFLMPRSSFVREFRFGSSRMNWKALSALKARWGVSKAALLYRARQLDLLSDTKYRSHIIALKKCEAKKEKDDHLLITEKSELIRHALESYITAYGKTVDDFLDELHVSESLLSNILDFNLCALRVMENPTSNVISMSKFTSK